MIDIMKSSTLRKLIAIFAFAVVAAAVLWGIQNLMEQKRSLGAISETVWAIDISPDSLQRDLRFTFALLLGAIALWSRRGALIALITALVVFVGIEFTTWLIAPRNVFDRTEVEYHLLAAALIGIAIILWLRGANYLMIAILAPGYILIESMVWYISTIRLKALLGVDQLQSSTTINNVFYGAHWWHVFTMGLSVLMIVCGIIAARNETSNNVGNVPA